MIGWREPRCVRPVGSVTSTVSSTSIRSSCSASQLDLPRRQRLVDRTPGLADALAGVLAGLRRQGPDLPVGQRQRRPVARVVEPDLLEPGQVGRRRDRLERLVARRRHLVGLQRGDLDGVVGRVGTGHAEQSRKAAPPGRDRVSRQPGLRARDGSGELGQLPTERMPSPGPSQVPLERVVVRRVRPSSEHDAVARRARGGRASVGYASAGQAWQVRRVELAGLPRSGRCSAGRSTRPG